MPLRRVRPADAVVPASLGLVAKNEESEGARSKQNGSSSRSFVSSFFATNLIFPARRVDAFGIPPFSTAMIATRSGTQ